MKPAHIKTITTAALLLLIAGCSTTTATTTGATTAKATTAKASVTALSAMKRYEGYHERRNRTALRKVLKVNPSTTPWCGYMLAYAVRAAGKKPPTGYPRAANWRNYGKPVSLSKARAGDVVLVHSRYGSGHVGLLTRKVKGKTCLIGGNTSNAVREQCYSNRAVRAIRR